MAHLLRRPGDVLDPGRRLGAGLELRVGGGERRRQLGRALRPRRRDRVGLPDPLRHQRQLRRRAHPVGHLALVRGVRGRPRVGVRSRRSRPGHDPARARLLQPRGGGRRPGRQAALPDRGPARRRPLPLHAGRLPGPRRRAARGHGRRRMGDGARPHRGLHGHAQAGPEHAEVQRRRGDLVRLGDDLLLDQGRQQGLGLRHRRGHARHDLRRRRAAHRRRQPHGHRAPARSSSARTAATWRSA